MLGRRHHEMLLDHRVHLPRGRMVHLLRGRRVHLLLGRRVHLLQGRKVHWPPDHMDQSHFLPPLYRSGQVSTVQLLNVD